MILCDAATDYRMYSAGYRAGQRLSSVGPLELHTSRMRTDNEYLIRLGANAYAQGFEDGWTGSVPEQAPLALSDLDNHFLGARD